MDLGAVETVTKTDDLAVDSKQLHANVMSPRVFGSVCSLMDCNEVWELLF